MGRTICGCSNHAHGMMADWRSSSSRCVVVLVDTGAPIDDLAVRLCLGEASRAVERVDEDAFNAMKMKGRVAVRAFLVRTAASTP